MSDFLKEREAQRRKLLDKYNYLTEHITDPKQKAFLSQILENQSEAPVNALFEVDGLTTNLPTAVFPSQIAFPAIVQAFPELAANELVQVVSMNSPRALVLFKNFIRSSNSALLTHSGSWSATSEVGTPAKGRMKLDTVEMVAQKYMLNMQWSAELAEDARALGNIDVQADLVAALRDEIAAQIDGLVITDLFTLPTRSAETGTQGNPAVRAGAGNVNFDTGTFDDYETPKAHQERLLDAIIDAKVAVFNASSRTPNFIVGNAGAVAEIEKMDTFALNQSSKTRIEGGTVRVGRLSGQYDVYLSDAAPDDKLLLGVKGAGFILGVYKPFELTPTTYLNETDEFISGMRTRVAKRIVDASYFASITLT